MRCVQTTVPPPHAPQREALCPVFTFAELRTQTRSTVARPTASVYKASTARVLRAHPVAIDTNVHETSSRLGLRDRSPWLQYNTIKLYCQVLIARGMFCCAKYTHYTFTPIIKRLITTANKHPGKKSFIDKNMRKSHRH